MIEENGEALGFYERFGFVPDGSVRRRELYGTQTKVVRLRFRAGLEIAEPASGLL
jgi:hypothetical protein